MSRHYVSGTSRDTVTGQVRGSCTISIYLAGTTTAASVYAAVSGGVAVNSVTSDAYGNFGFYIDEATYGLTQRFKIIVSKTGYDSQTYDNLPFFSLDSIDTDGTLAANSDKKIATQKATKTYADTKIAHSLATAANDFLVASGVGVFIKKTLAEVRTLLGLESNVPAATAENDFIVAGATPFAWVKKTLAEVKTILGLGTAAYTASADYDAAGTAAGKIASSISDGDTTHAPDGNSVFDALALKSTETVWTDYSATSTIIGWSSFTTKKLYYKKIGKTVFISFYFAGTSDSTSVTFTLPFTSSNTLEVLGVGRAYDNGGASIACAVYIHANSDSVGASKDMTGSGGSWTASGTKLIEGQFFFDVA